MRVADETAAAAAAAAPARPRPPAGPLPDAPVRPGRPWPLGAAPDAEGVNFAVFSAHASRVELCLLDPTGTAELRRVELPERTDHVFHGRVPGLAPGQVYGYRAHGPWAPAEGHRFNPARLLLDPHARAVTGRLLWAGPNLVDPADPFAPDPRDSAPFVPKSVVAAPPAPVPEGERPRTPWDRTVLYEAHAKGLTRLHPALPPRLRGTFAGLGHPAVVGHLASLGVTAVELLPVTAVVDELRLHRLGLSNHWGYNPLALMAPEPRYAADAADPAGELREAVRALHAAGIEVVLDLVFNHTGEGDHLGPALSLKGLDNRTYYRPDPADPRRYADHAGTGNSLDLSRPPVLRLVLDALRAWAALGVDGFRLDLAASLGRGRDGGFDPEAAFFQAVAQDPALAGLKMIAEPWDVGPGGYRAGEFPAPFAEWNDRFRDGVRRFWRGDRGTLPELATRLLGSADRFDHRGRRPWAAVNYVAAHDGLTTRDLVTYSRKRNEANGEGNRDGHADEHAANHGAEGETDDPAVKALRLRQRRNLLATLLLAQGTPMLLMGDEVGRTQGGNSNAYCQDNPTSWYPWQGTPPEEEAFRAFVARLTALRRAHPALRRRRFLHGLERGGFAKDVAWISRDGREKAHGDWREPGNRCFGLLLDGTALAAGDRDEAGRPARDGLLLLLANAEAAPVPFPLPAPPGVAAWEVLIDTADPDAGTAAVPPVRHRPGAKPPLPERSLRLLLAVPRETVRPTRTTGADELGRTRRRRG